MFTTVTRVVLAAAVGLTLACSATPAMAQVQVQPTPPVAEEPTEVERPELLSAVATCADGVATVDVHLRYDRDEPFSITLARVDGEPFLKTQQTHLTDNFDHLATFTEVPPGQYSVRSSEGTQPSDSVDVVVKSCKELPAGEQLGVEVECKAGWGIVTFVVTNPTSGDTKSYTLTTGDLSTEYEIDLGEGEFLSITENGFEDDDYSVTLKGDGIEEPITKKFKVACEAKNAPRIGAYARCDGKDDINAPAPVYLEVANPNRAPVEYTIKAGGAERVLSVEGGGDGFVELDPLPAGVHSIKVLGSDSTVAETDVAVDDCAGVKIDADGLQVQVQCVERKSVVTFRFFDVEGEHPVKRDFTVDGAGRFDETVEFRNEGAYQWTRHSGKFADGDYTARLVGGGLNTVEKFAVKCADQPSTTTPPTTTPAPSTTTSPAPQGGAAPATGDDLPVTGAAVGGMVALGLAALGLGGFLVITARRRRSAK